MVYRVSQRRSFKIIPRDKYEGKEMGWMKRPKLLSKRYPIKTMLLVVVGRPLPHRHFNGKIHLERVANNKYASTRTARTNFYTVINSEIKSGG